MSERRSEIGED